jgi:dihydrofolate reductase
MGRGEGRGVEGGAAGGRDAIDVAVLGRSGGQGVRLPRRRGGTLVPSLIAEGLLDELHLFVNPTAIGAGLPVFPNVGAHQRFRLVTARPFDCGVTASHYEPKNA